MGQVEPVEDAFDEELFEELRDLYSDEGPGVFKEQLDLFLKGAKDNIQNIQVGLDTKDLHLVYKAAHTLKGSAGTAGAMRMYKMAQDIEAFGHQKDAEKAAKALPNLEDELLNVIQYIKKHL